MKDIKIEAALFYTDKKSTTNYFYLINSLCKKIFSL